MSLIVLLALLVATPDTEGDLAAARALFEANIRAIQDQDREAYLACYAADDELLRAGPEGVRLGYTELAEGTPATGSDTWPDELLPFDLQLHPVADGLVYGTYRYRARDGLDVREGLSERLFQRTPEGWRIRLTTAFDAPPGQPPAPLALVGATLHDGSGGPPLADAVVLVRNGRIEALGSRDAVPLPAGVERVELADRHLVPGLIDTHVHYSQTGWADGRPDARDLRATYPYEQVAAELEAHPERFHRAFLASGITAVFDVGGFPWTRRLGALTEQASLAPHVVSAGPLLATYVPATINLPDRQQLVLMEDEAGTRAMVRSHAAAGSDAIKIWFLAQTPDDVEAAAPLVRAAGDEARGLGLPLIVHATELATARVAVEAGAHLLVHSVQDQDVDQAFVDAALAAGVFYCPTLTVHRGYVHLYEGVLPSVVEHQLEQVHPWVARRIAFTESLGPDPRFDEEELLGLWEANTEREATMAANLMRLHEAGVPVVLGTDAGNPLTLHGPSVGPELVAMAAAGLTPSEVLVAATRDAARALGRGDDLGLLAPGRVADLLVLTDDPREDVTHLQSITHVMRGGTLQTPETILGR